MAPFRTPAGRGIGYTISFRADPDHFICDALPVHPNDFDEPSAAIGSDVGVVHLEFNPLTLPPGEGR